MNGKYAPIILREKRALKRKGMTKKTFRLIVQNQTTDSVRRRGSDYIINNTFDIKYNILEEYYIDLESKLDYKAK